MAPLDPAALEKAAQALWDDEDRVPWTDLAAECARLGEPDFQQAYRDMAANAIRAYLAAIQEKA